jgi:hypothetical protein
MVDRDHLRRVADKDSDSLVSLDKCLTSCEVTLGDGILFNQLVSAYEASLFELWDRDGDGRRLPGRTTSRAVRLSGSAEKEGV